VTDDPAVFAAAVVGLLENEAGARKTGDRAARWAREEFNWEASVDGTLAWYDELRSAAGSSTQ
jgi:glycosyltransferase involved in cell wall biosynthesis